MKLYYRPGTAAMAPHAALAEIGAAYELVRVEFETPMDASDDYRRLNPWGRVPTLVDGDLVLTESAAIVLHLADTNPEARLLPPLGSRERAHAYRWLVYLTNTVQAGLVRLIYPERYTADEACVEGIRALEAAELARHFDWIESRLGDRDWLVGDERGAADLYLFMLTRWARRLDPPAWDRPALRAHFARTLALPGVRRMVEEQALDLSAAPPPA